MRGISVKGPERSLAICVLVSALAAAAVWSGAREISVSGSQAGWSGVAVGVGLVFLIIAPLMALNFWRAVRAIAALERGRRVIARWTVSAEELAAFNAMDARRSALGPEYRNWYRPPESAPAGGLSVIFGDDAVLLGREYFGLSPTGMFRYGGVQIISDTTPSIEFGVVFTSMHDTGSSVSIDRHTGVVRAPIARDALTEARGVLQHFEQVASGAKQGNPGFWPSRRRIGLVMALLGAASFALGMLLPEALDPKALIRVITAVLGVITCLGGLFVMALAWALDPYKKKRF